MTALGSPEEWVDFIETQVLAILTLVIETWETLPPPAGNELEDAVSESLCQCSGSPETFVIFRFGSTRN